jgi:chemotaxis protein CheD
MVSVKFYKGQPGCAPIEMKNIIAEHSCTAFLKPGEIIVSRNPVLVSTILGSCVAVTMYSPGKKVGAICHAMYPQNPQMEESFLYVEPAIRNIFNRMIEYGGQDDMVVKLFGGSQVLAGGEKVQARKTIGEQNIILAKKILQELGLSIAGNDVGGMRGRKLYFSIMTGDVYLRKLRLNQDVCCRGML